MSEKWLNLSIEKDAGYSKLMVLSSALFSTALFGFNGALNLITADWKIDKNLPFETAALHSTFQVTIKLNRELCRLVFDKRLLLRDFFY